MSETSRRTREERLKQALRANLQRRKAQARGRVEAPAEVSERPARTESHKPTEG